MTARSGRHSSNQVVFQRTLTFHAHPEKIERTILALLGTFEFCNGRLWKRFDFEMMQSLEIQGLISDPRGLTDSVHLATKGLAKCWPTDFSDLERPASCPRQPPPLWQTRRLR